jgi:phosphoglycolate phosphatase
VAALDLPDLIVFDLAGTIVHDGGQVAQAFAGALAGEGLAVTPQRLSTIRGASKRQVIEDLLPRGPDRAQRADHVYTEFRTRLAERLSDEPFTEIDGVAETFGWLARRSVRLALNTGFERAIALPVLATLGWDVGVFAAIVCADEVARGRPAPDLIQEAMMRIGVTRPDRVANVGDTAIDLRAAHAARVRWNIGVLSGAHSRAQLQDEPHTILLDSVADLPTHVFAAAD